MSSIPHEDLPRTFREAIFITRELGIPYIWIDSLCIIQDDLEDWRQEADRMNYIFSCSAITISALDAKNGTEGCFVDDYDTHMPVPRGLQFTPLSVSFPQTSTPTLVRAYRGDLRYRARDSHLSTRGWTLQEQLLSHREVLCAQPEAHWKCRRGHSIESGLHLRGPEYARFWNHSLPVNLIWQDMHELWTACMEDYSRRQFTFEKDRLSALVGIVQAFDQGNLRRHILAAWEQSMIADLLWLRFGEPVDPSLVIPGVPSWTWLSRAADVEFDFWAGSQRRDAVVKDHTKVIEARVSWTGQPLVSSLESTSLVLEGPVKKLRLRADPRAQDFNPPYILHGDEVLDFEKHPIPWRCAGRLDMEDIPQDGMFTCLLMRSAMFSNNDRFHSLRETMLLLESAGDGTYRRVGIAMIAGEDSEFATATTETLRLI